MKQLPLLFSSLVFIGCNQYTQVKSDNTQQVNKSNDAAELINNGFLKYADSSKVDTLKTGLLNSFDIYEYDNFRIIHIDAEELAEFSFDFFLPVLNKILSKRNINISAQQLSSRKGFYYALINGDTVLLYTQKDVDDDTFWDKAPRHFFKKVNEILKESGEQFYLLYGGNDLHGLLLTDKQFSIISNYYKDNDKEKPYRP
ncbi:MAG TPA: hypothetical protein VHB48_19015 [Chitinophagaceae bacterium]|nr:hypothetical protein [Chitinophagaceae bacterium]